MQTTSDMISATLISEFLDDPVTKAKSAVRVEFSPVAELSTVADAIFYITKLGPIPFLLCRQGDAETKESAVESVGGPTKLSFCRSPSTDSPDADLAEIVGWFNRSGVSVEILPINVTQWFREQFSGSADGFRIAIEAGWRPIVADVCQQIQTALTSAELQQFRWMKIKQNNGTLAMHWRLHVPIASAPCNEFGRKSYEIEDGWQTGAENEFASRLKQRITAIIAFAQDRASETCEFCGADGKLRPQPTVNVLCDDCHENWEQVLSAEFGVTSR